MLTDIDGVDTVRKIEKDKISLLLPYYLDHNFSDLFQDYGFRVFWASKREDAEKIVAENEPDIAIEWQYGPNDYPIRDMLRKYGRRTPVILALNWNNLLPHDDPREIGYAGYCDVPFNLDELMSLFYKVLPDRKKLLF